jgi:hypothetical protein
MYLFLIEFHVGLCLIQFDMCEIEFHIDENLLENRLTKTCILLIEFQVYILRPYLKFDFHTWNLIPHI